MTNEDLALFFALGATLCFASSSLVFTEFSKRVSVLWMNCFKAFVAFTALLLTIPIFSGWHPPTPMAVGGFLLSGLLGLNIGDLFLLSAFTRLGAARTLILFGFQPLLVGIAAHFLFDQALDPSKLIAVVFLMGCLLTFSLESYRAEKRWEWLGLVFALVGVLFDTCGILVTRAAFSLSPNVTPMEGHFYRCLGALIGFAVMSRFKPVHLISGFMRWTPRTRLILFSAGLGGTYLSLLLYLNALKIGHLASVAGITITGPMFATLLESIVNRKPPSRYLLVAFALFCIGFYILIAPSAPSALP